jgi:type IV secretory pathway TraG/TraD family ATPase VirD4
MSIHQRRPGNGPTWALLGVEGLLLGGVVYGVLQLGHWLNTAEWLPANPAKWAKLQPRPWDEWGIVHTALAIGMGVAFAAQVILVGMTMRKRRVAADHVDARAGLMGTGKELTLKAVQAKNATAKYTVGTDVGLPLGRAVYGGKTLWADWRSTVMAVMNPGAGKTSALVIKWVLKAPGWAYATANKPDLYVAVRYAREQKGRFWCFDPQKVAEVEPTWYWNPLTYIYGPGPECAADADTKATTQANIFADAARIMDAKTDGFFEPEGINLLSALLLAGAVDKRPITDIVFWINNPDQGGVPVRILRDAGWALSASNLDFAFHLNTDTKRGVFANAKRVINFLFNRQALAWIVQDGSTDMRSQFDPHQFVRSQGDTMISLSEEGTGSLGPLVAALTVAITEAARSYAKTCPGGRIDPTGVLALDEVANVARIKPLPDWFSHFASQGLLCLAIFQSLAQGRAAWGKDGMDKLSGASTHRLYGRGIDEMELLEKLSKIVGPYDRRTYSTGNSTPSGALATGGGRASRSVNAQYHEVPILNPSDIAALPEWRMIVHYGGGRPVLTKMEPYFLDPEMDALVKRSIELYGPRSALTI